MEIGRSSLTPQCRIWVIQRHAEVSARCLFLHQQPIADAARLCVHVLSGAHSDSA
jgi:hypothetical protein